MSSVNRIHLVLFQRAIGIAQRRFTRSQGHKILYSFSLADEKKERALTISERIGERRSGSESEEPRHLGGPDVSENGRCAA